MKILHICDTPENLMDLGDLASMKLELVLTSGDLPRPIYDRIRAKLPDVPLYGVRGGHDGPTELTAAEDLHLRVIEIGGLKVAGFQGSWRYKPAGRYLYTDNEVSVALSRFPNVDVLVTHNPPALDGHELLDDIHNGFTSFVEYCARSGVKYLFHGHSSVEKQTRMGATLVIGSYGRRVIDLPDWK
ncbi:MAG: metallophosphoesterase family protein [Candidatus Wallbacteria bacterium]|nr:metallophosphoesterase family protein [Candidatus Wallbacteria bacterium]